MHSQDVEPDYFIDYKSYNQPLELILQQIAQNEKVQFAYRNSLIRSDMIFTGTFKHQPLNQVIGNILASFNLCYIWMNGQFIIHDNCGPNVTKIKGRIFDISTSTPIPFVSVSIRGTTIGTVADQNGYFELKVEKNLEDSLIITSLNFETVTLSIDSLLKIEILDIYLNPKVYKLDPVVVEKRDFKTRYTGNAWGRPEGTLYIDTQGQQTAIHVFDRRQRKGRIRAVNYYLSEAGNIDAPFIVKLYSVKENKPDSNLLPYPIIVKPDIEEGWFQVDLRQFYIEFPPEGIFVGIEGIYPEEYDYFQGPEISDSTDDDIPKTLAYGQQLGFNTSYADKTWHLSINKKWFQLENQPHGVMISATIDFYKKKKKKNR